MRYAKQRLTILFFLAMLPLALALALADTPQFSQASMRVALRWLRLRTGLRVDARGWELHPVSLAVSLEDVHLILGPLELGVPRLEAQFSPWGLLLGIVQLREVRLEKPFVAGKLDPAWLQSDEKEKSKSFREQLNRDWPGELAQQVNRALRFLGKNNLGFEQLRIAGLRVALPEFKLDSADLEVENLDGGQARAEWTLRGFRYEGVLPRVEAFEGSVALLKASSRGFALVLPKFRFTPQAGVASIDINGRWPGDARVQLRTDLKALAGWMKPSPKLKELLLPNLAGQVDGDVDLRLGQRKKDEGGFHWKALLRTKALTMDDFAPNDLRLSARGSLDEATVDSLDIDLPRMPGDSPKWKNQIHVREARWDGATGKLSARLDLDEAGHCGILRGSGVDECLAAFAASGKIAAEGQLEPFNLRVTLDTQLREPVVASDAFGSKEYQSPLLHPKDAALSGRIDFTAKNMEVVNALLQWKDGSRIRIDGKIDFVPTLVDLRAEASGAQIENMVSDFIDLKPLGRATVSSQIHYSSQVPKQAGRTRVLNRVLIENIGIEGQNFGTLTGPVNYVGNRLRLGPLKLTSGGGHATIDGVLEPGPKGSVLSLGGTMERIELSGVTPESRSEIFRGFVSGSAQLSGILDTHSPNFFSGPIEARVDTFKAFGIPFQRGALKARYDKGVLQILELKAQRNRANVSLHGHLDPKGGSELLFSSEAMPIKGLGLDPGLELFQNGKVEVNGWWRPSQGFLVQGQLQDLRIAGASLPNGKVELKGDDKSMRISTKLGQQLSFDWHRSLEGKGRPLGLRAEIHDQGFYAAFAYLKAWNSPMPVSAKGDLWLNWTPQSGSLHTKNLEVSGPAGPESRPTVLLNAPGPHEFSWSGRTLEKNTFSFDGPLAVQARAAPGASEVRLDLKVPLAFLDLLIPNFRFSDGRAEMEAVMPLPPDLSTLKASGSLEDGTLYIRGLGQPLQKLQADLDLRRQQLSFQGGRGQLGGGTATFDGVYRLDFAASGVSMQIGLDRAHVVIMDDVPADITGNLTLKGEDTPYLLAGKVQATNALYAREFKEDTALQPATNVKPLLKFNLDVELGTNVQVKNSLTAAQLDGRIFVNGDDLKPDMQGTIHIQSGSVFAKETEFKISQGVVNFPGGAQAVPVVNLQAATVVKQQNQNFKIDLRAHGAVNNLEIEFQSDPALSTPDIINLLAFGVIRSNTEDLNTAVGTGSSSSTSNSTAGLIGAARIEAFQALFGQAVGSSLDKSTGFQVRFKAAPDYYQKEIIPKVTVVRKLSDRMTATFGRSLDITKPEKNFQVDYKLFNNVNLTGVWESPEADKNSGGLDLRFRFDVK